MAYVDTIGDIIRVTMATVMQLAQLQETSVYYQCVASGGGDSRNLINTNVDSTCTAQWVPFLNTGDAYFGSKVSFIKGGPLYAPTITRLVTAGTSAFNQAPTQIRGLITWRTAFFGVQYRGRSFQPTPTVNFLTSGGHFTTSYVTAIKNWANDLQADQNVGGSVWRRVLIHGDPKVGLPPIPTVVTANEASSLCATQRRSGDYGRANPAPPW